MSTGDEMEAEHEQENAPEYSSLPVGTRALVAELLATLSHELRSPLATIKAYTATLLHRERSISRAKRHAFLLVIERATDHLEAVIDHLLENAVNYSPEGGTIHVVLRTVSPSDRAARSDLPPQVSNGRSGRTMPTLSGLPGEQEWVEISVRDAGLGIAAEHLPRVFDPFYRVDTRLSREVNGLGIGLTICKRIVELHGGVIWVESTVGAGSTFHVWLLGGRQHAVST